MSDNYINYVKLEKETQNCTQKETKKSSNIKGSGIIAILLVVILLIIGGVYVGTQYWFHTEVSKEDSSEMEKTVEVVITSISQFSKEDMESYLMISEFQLDYTMMTSSIHMVLASN